MKKLGRHPMEGEFGRIARTMAGTRGLTVDTTTMNCDTDGKTVIRIPANADFLKGAHKQVIHGLLDHEWLHVKAERVAVEQRKLGKRVMLPSEAMKRQPDAKHRQMLNVYKDIADELAGAEEFRGVSENLDVAGQHSMKELYNRRGELTMWRQVTCGIISVARGQDTSFLSDGARAIIDQLTDEIEDSRKARTTEDCVKLVDRTMAKLQDLSEPEPEQGEGEGEGEQGEGEGEQGEGGGKSGQAGDEDGDEGGSGDETDGDSGDDGDSKGSGSGDEEQADGDSQGETKPSKGDSKGDSSDSDAAKDGEGAKRPSGTTDPAAQSAAAEAMSDEENMDDLMDAIREAVTEAAYQDAKSNKRHIPHPEAAKLDKLTIPAKGDIDTYRLIQRSVRPAVSALRSKLLTLLRTLALGRTCPDCEEGELDQSALHRVKTGDRRVFTQDSPGETIDTAVSILRDFSGSMSGAKEQMERDACIAISEALDQLGIPFEVISFQNDWNREVHGGRGDTSAYNRFEPFIFRLYKGFNEKFKIVKTRFNRSYVTGNNADGEAIRFIAKRLADQPQARKILIVLSDGAPAAMGDNRIHLNDTKDAVKECQAAGIETIGIGIQDMTVASIYPDHAVISNLNDLAPALFKLLKTYLIDHRRNRKLARAS